MNDLTKLEKIKQELKKQKLHGLVISNALNIAHLTGFTNFSSHEREAYLFITQNSQFIFTDGRYTEAVAKQVKDFKLIEISYKKPIQKFLEDLAKKSKLKKVGVEEDDLKVSEHNRLQTVFKKLHSFDVKQIRSIKSDAEIKAIEKACQLGGKVLKHILKKIKIGVTERELASEIEIFVIKHGGKLSFETIVAFGPNSSVPHHQTSNTKLEDRKGQFVLFDLGTKIDGYCSDMTRTVFFGSPSDKQKKIYQTVLVAQTKAAKYLDDHIKSNSQKKITGAMVDKVARDYIKSQGFIPYSHGLGHGIGLEVHEPPFLSVRGKQPLKIGMVFSIEPGIYEPHFGGVRIEDLYVLDALGLRKLTKSPSNLIEL